MIEAFESNHDEFTARKAFEFFRNGEYETAELICKQVIRINPHDFNALHLIGILCLISMRFEESVSFFESALKENPLDPPCNNNLGEAYRSVGRLNEAEARYRDAIALDQTYTDAYCNLGLLLGVMERLAESEFVLRQALQLNPNHVATLGNLGLIYMRDKKRHDAEEAFKRAVSFDLHNIELHLHLINCQTALGNIGEAEQSCRQALLVHNNSEILQNRLGLLLKELGRYEEARQAFESAIHINPQYPVAYTNMGVLMHSLGHLESAEEAFRKSLEFRQDCVEAYCNLGVVLKEQGFLQEAEEAILHALVLNSTSHEAHNHLAGVFHVKGQSDKAENSYRQSLHLKPDYLEAMSNLASLLISNNRHEEAEELLSEIVRQQPSNMMAIHVLMALKGEAPSRAPESYVSALFDGYANGFDNHLVKSLGYCTPAKLYNLLLAHIADNTEMDILDLGCGTGLIGELVCCHAKNLVGVDLSSKMLEKARGKSIYNRLVGSDLLTMMKNERAESFDLILAADVFIYLGLLDDIVLEARRILRSEGLLAFSVENLDAIDNLVESVELPNFKLMPTVRYCHSRHYIFELAEKAGLTVEHIEMVDDRFESGRAVKFLLVIMSISAGNSNPLEAARIARDRNDWDTAITAYLSRLQAVPADKEALIGVGACLQMQNRHDAAAEWYDRALQLVPSDSVLHCNRALSLLTLGQYQEGWQELQWRKQLITESLPPFPFLTPELMGGLTGKRLLLHTEQGFGDTIQMLRYLPLLAEKGAEIVITAPPPLVRLIAAQPSVQQVIPHGDLLPTADYQTLMQDLPWLFGTTAGNIPDETPYLRVPEHLRVIWQKRVEACAENGRDAKFCVSTSVTCQKRVELKVGLAWACGGGDPRNRALRSLKFNDLAPLLELSHLQFYSLQIGTDVLTDQQRFRYANMHDLTNLIADFADTAALILALDYVITVDTAVAHLAGALGKPVWLMLPSFREWRWMERDKKTMWYPTIEVLGSADSDSGWGAIVLHAKRALALWNGV